MTQGEDAFVLIFDQRFLAFEKLIALHSITHPKCSEFAVEHFQQHNLTQFYSDVLNFFQSDENVSKWIDFLANNPDAAAAVQNAKDRYDISTELLAPITCTNSAGFGKLRHDAVYLNTQLKEPMFYIDQKYFEIPDLSRHYDAHVMYAAHGIRFLRDIRKLRESQKDYAISDECLDLFDNVLAPEHRQLLLEGSRSPIEMLLSMFESVSDHAYGNEWSTSTPYIHPSWVEVFERVCETENTVFLLFLLIRFLNQRRLFLNEYREISIKLRFVDVVLMAISFLFPLSGYSFGNTGEDQYYDSTVASRDSFYRENLLSLLMNSMFNSFSSFDMGNIDRQLALYNSRLFIFLSEIWNKNASSDDTQDSFEILSLLERKTGHLFGNNLLYLLLDFASMSDLSTPALNSTTRNTLMNFSSDYSLLIDNSLSGTHVPPLPLPEALKKDLRKDLVERCLEALNLNSEQEAPHFIAIRCFDKLCSWHSVDVVCKIFLRYPSGIRSLKTLSHMYRTKKGTLNGKKRIGTANVISKFLSKNGF
ncbi:hypothetical protein GEMRC1_004638 [Eukaryota sp. GEM-RC1]